MTNSSPTNTCYSCIILLACSFIRLLYDGMWSSFGVFFVAWETQFDVSASTLALIGVSFLPVSFLIGPLSSAVAHKLSYRTVVIIGGILAVAAFFSMSLAKELWHINLIMAVCGIGLGLAYLPACSFYVFYFQRYFGFANGINASSSGIGTLIVPPFVDTLVNRYGWRGAMLFMSAVMANICVCGALMVLPNFERSLKHHKRNHGIKTTTSTKEVGNKSTFSSGGSTQNGIVQLNSTPSTDYTAAVQREIYTNPKITQNTAFSENDDSDEVSEFAKDLQTCTVIPERICNCFKIFYDVLDLSLFCKVRFLFNCLLTPFLYGCLYPPFLYFVPLCVEAGISTLKASLVMSAIGIFTVIARLSPIGLMVDKGILSASKTGGLAAIIGGVAITIVPFAKSYVTFVTIGCTLGLLPCGTAGALYMYLVRESAGSTEKVPGAVAWANLSVGVGVVPCILLTGFLRDLTSSYVASYVMSGVGLMCMGVIMLSDPYLIKWQRQIEAKRDKEHKTQEL